MKTVDLNKFYKEFPNYCELKIQESTEITITILDGNVINNTKDSIEGISARVCEDGNWGFASDSVITDDSIDSVIHQAKNNAEFLKDRGIGTDIELYVTDYSVEKSFKTLKIRKTQRELVEFGMEVYAYIKDRYNDLSSIKVNIYLYDLEKEILTSSKANYKTLTPRSNVTITLMADREGSPVEVIKNFGGLGQFEDIFLDIKDLYEGIEETYKRLIDKREGVYAKAGVWDVILDSAITGLLAHEAIGHTTEADMVLGGSIASENLNNQVASSLITMKDIAHTAFGKTCPVPVYIDDEGTMGEDVTIIENGILKEFMHSKETAAKFRVKPKGNARATEYYDEPLIRMRNTCFIPGKDKLEDMISSIENGYYLVGATNGQADTTSEFMFGIAVGYEIKNGKIGRAILDTTISGVAFEVLKTVSMVSDEIKWSNGGWCGKKQLIKVGMGGPSIKCKINIGGK